MKNKIKKLGIVFLSMIGMIVLFITLVGIGNYFQSIDLHILGNIFMLLFPVAVYFAVKIFNKRINKLNSKTYGFGFNKFASTFLLGVGLALALQTFVLLISNLFFGVEIEFNGFKNDFEKPLLNLLTTLILVGIWEEFYFRGLVFNTFLKTSFGFHLSALISSLLFSIVHWFSFDMAETSWLWYLGIVFIGYLLVFIYSYTKSIWSVVSFHFIWNFITMLMDNRENEIGLFEVSNYIEHSKKIDDITVICLGFILGIIFFLSRKGRFHHKINAFENLITTNNNLQKK